MAEDNRREQEFSFVKEKIKRQPVYQTKTFKKAVFQLVLAALCGAVACFVFVVLQPWMQEAFGKEKRTEISLPREEEEPAEQAEEPEELQDPVVIAEPRELEPEDYEQLFDKLYGVAGECAGSLVTVTAASSDTDWFNETYENKEQLSGILIGNNGVELLILTVYSGIASADQLQVTFADKSTLDGALKNYDMVTDLAVVSVNLADVEERTMESVRMAELGSSLGLRSGDPVIAVGSPAGTAGTVLYGNLVETEKTVSVIDGEYKLLTTDIVKGLEGSGVLLNLEGEIIGLIENKYSDSGERNVLTAYAISGMKDVMEHLSNSQDIVYMGITGVSVTTELVHTRGLPGGVYVTGVEMNSPAMNAGIRRGDILTEISGIDVTAISEMQKMLLKFSKDQTIQVTVMREGREGYTEIPCSVALDVLR